MNPSVLNGVLLVDKEPDMTSHDVVAKARRLLGTRSIGHAGTLDPMASGLLLLLVGEATKISDYLLTGDKGYEVSVRLGLKTDSMDITGQELERKTIPADLTEDKIKEAAVAASGILNLAVPMHSAVKVDGKKLYKSAHKGEIPPEIPIRAMEFYDVEWHGLKNVPVINSSESWLDFTVRLRCSKGSYIRAWANYVGEQLGCGGTVSVLRRVLSAPYKIDQAVNLRDLADRLAESGPVGATDIAGVLKQTGGWIPLAEALPHFGRIEIEGYDATLLRNGQLSKGVQAELLRSIQLGVQPKPVRVIHREERRLLALLVAEQGEFYKIRRVFV